MSVGSSWSGFPRGCLFSCLSQGDPTPVQGCIHLLLLPYKLRQYLRASSLFCTSEVRAQWDWVLCSGSHKVYSQGVGWAAFSWSSQSSAKLMCSWQNSVAGRWSAEVPLSLLAICWGPISAPEAISIPCHVPPPSSKPPQRLFHFEPLFWFKSLGLRISFARKNPNPLRAHLMSLSSTEIISLS